MAISTACESCGRDYKVKEELAGKRFKCKDCGEVVTVPVGRTGAKAASSLKSSTTQKKVEDDDEDFLSALNSAAKDMGEAVDDEDEEFEAAKPKARSKAKAKSARRKSNEGSGSAMWAKVGSALFAILVALGAIARLVNGVGGFGVSWREFSAPDGSYSVQMPGKPEFKTKIESGMNLSIYVASTRNFACGVSQGRLPLMLANVPAEVFYANFQQGAALTGQKIDSMIDATIGGQPAKEIRYTKAGIRSVSRILISSGMLYEVQFMSQSEPAANEVARFFDSFRLGAVAAASRPPT